MTSARVSSRRWDRRCLTTPRCAMLLAIICGLSVGPASARAQEEENEPAVFRPFSLGQAIETHDMRVEAQLYPAVEVYGLQDEGAGQAVVHGKEFVHLTCIARARAGNPYGFRNGEWVPGLRVRFTLTHQGTGAAVEGNLFPMVARDGPHYGVNLQLMGEGDYTLVYHIRPPSAQVLTRVTSAPAGVPDWWEPFNVTLEFTYNRDDVFSD